MTFHWFQRHAIKIIIGAVVFVLFARAVGLIQ